MTVAALVRGLRAGGLAATVAAIEEILWLAEHLPAANTESAAPLVSQRRAPQDETARLANGGRTDAAGGADADGKAGGTDAAVNAAAELFSAPLVGSVSASVLRVPGVAPMLDAGDLRRALRPFARRVPSRWRRTLDVEETATRAADSGIWYPFFRPLRERWFDLSLVIDDSASMDLWAETVAQFQRLLRSEGGFKSVAAYGLSNVPGTEVTSTDGTAQRSVARLLDRNGHHLILLVTDGTSARWRDGSAQAFIRELGTAAAVSILQLLPRRAWRHSLVGDPELRLFAERPGDANTRLKAITRGEMDEADTASSLLVPVIGLDTATLGQWARMITAHGDAAISGLAIAKAPASVPSAADALAVMSGLPAGAENPKAKVARYRQMVSRGAYDLAVFLSVPDPLTVPVMRLVQRVMLPDTGIQELVEFFLGGLLERKSAEADSREATYRLAGGVRGELTRSLRLSEEDEISKQLRAIGSYLEETDGDDGRAFKAYFPSPVGRHRLTDWSLPFGSVSRAVLRGYAPKHPTEKEFSPELARRPAGIIEAAGRPEPPTTKYPERSLLRTFTLLHNHPAPLADARILWVDDRPSNNLSETNQLKRLGADCITVTSTAGALGLMSGSAPFDIVLTDMARPEGNEAGMQLLAEVRTRQRDTPVIIYAARWVAQEANRNRALHAGAFGVTNQREQLIEFVLAAAAAAVERRFMRHYRKALAESKPLQRIADDLLRASPEAVAVQIASLISGPDDGFRALVMLLSAFSQSEYVQLFRLEFGKLRLVASQIDPRLATYEVASFEGLIGRAFTTKRLVWAPDVTKEHAYIAAEKSTKSELVIPWIEGGANYVINIERTVPNAYSSTQIQWLADFVTAYQIPEQGLPANSNQTASRSGQRSRAPRILVAGTGLLKLPDSVRWLAQELGVRIAQSGMHLVAGGWPGVDHIVTRAFANTMVDLSKNPGKHLTQVLEPGQKANITIDGAEIVVRHDWANASVNQADAVVLIGGLGGTYDIFEAAVAKSMPVTPIAGSGGDAAKAALKLVSLGQPEGEIMPESLSFVSIEVDSLASAAFVIDGVIDRINLALDAQVQERYWSMAATLLGVAEATDPAIRLSAGRPPGHNRFVSALEGIARRASLVEYVSNDLSTIDGAASALETFGRERPRWLAAAYFDLADMAQVWPAALQLQAAIMTAILRVDKLDKFTEFFDAFTRHHTEAQEFYRAQLLNVAETATLTVAHRSRLNSWLDQIEVSRFQNSQMPQSSDWALSIGISDFLEFPRLAAPSHDAQAFASWLTDPSYGSLDMAKTRVVTGFVSNQQLLSNLQWLKGESEKRSLSSLPPRRAYIFISSHGVANPSSPGWSMIASDTQVGSAPGALNIFDIRNYLVHFQEALVIIDIGASWLPPPQTSDILATSAELSRGAIVWLLFADHFDVSKSNMSIVLDGLRGEAFDDGNGLTVDALYRYVSIRLGESGGKLPLLFSENQDAKLLLVRPRGSGKPASI